MNEALFLKLFASMESLILLFSIFLLLFELFKHQMYVKSLLDLVKEINLQDAILLSPYLYMDEKNLVPLSDEGSSTSNAGSDLEIKDPPLKNEELQRKYANSRYRIYCTSSCMRKKTQYEICSHSRMKRPARFLKFSLVDYLPIALKLIYEVFSLDLERAFNQLNAYEFEGSFLKVEYMMERGPGARSPRGAGRGGPGMRNVPYSGNQGFPLRASDFPLRILVLSDMAGAIIGRSGGTIRQITQQSGARFRNRKETGCGCVALESCQPGHLVGLHWGLRSCLQEHLDHCRVLGLDAVVEIEVVNDIV